MSPEGNLWLPGALQWKVLKSLNQLYPNLKEAVQGSRAQRHGSVDSATI
jgi:hypothetical protein